MVSLAEKTYIKIGTQIRIKIFFFLLEPMAPIVQASAPQPQPQPQPLPPQQPQAVQVVTLNEDGNEEASHVAGRVAEEGNYEGGEGGEEGDEGEEEGGEDDYGQQSQEMADHDYVPEAGEDEEGDEGGEEEEEEEEQGDGDDGGQAEAELYAQNNKNGQSTQPAILPGYAHRPAFAAATTAAPTQVAPPMPTQAPSYAPRPAAAGIGRGGKRKTPFPPGGSKKPRRVAPAPAALANPLPLPPVCATSQGSTMVQPAFPPVAGQEKVIMADNYEATLLENAGARKYDKDGSMSVPYGQKLYVSDTLYVQWVEKTLPPKRAGLAPKVYDNMVMFRIYQSAKAEDQGVYKIYTQQCSEDEAMELSHNIAEFIGHKRARPEKSIKGRFV